MAEWGRAFKPPGVKIKKEKSSASTRVGGEGERGKKEPTHETKALKKGVKS